MLANPLTAFYLCLCAAAPVVAEEETLDVALLVVAGAPQDAETLVWAEGTLGAAQELPVVAEEETPDVAGLVVLQDAETLVVAEETLGAAGLVALPDAVIPVVAEETLCAALLVVAGALQGAETLGAVHPG